MNEDASASLPRNAATAIAPTGSKSMPVASVAARTSSTSDAALERSPVKRRMYVRKLRATRRSLSAPTSRQNLAHRSETTVQASSSHRIEDTISANGSPRSSCPAGMSPKKAFSALRKIGTLAVYP